MKNWNVEIDSVGVCLVLGLTLWLVSLVYSGTKHEEYQNKLEIAAVAKGLVQCPDKNTYGTHWTTPSACLAEKSN